MKKLLTIVFCMISFLSFVHAQAMNPFHEEFMNIDEVCQQWGELPLDTVKFKNADENEPLRAKMTCSLLKNQKRYFNMNESEIREIFGNPSGYYENEMVPTYLIEIAETEKQDSWQVVFLINKEGKVFEIVVHKNCCKY